MWLPAESQMLRALKALAVALFVPVGVAAQGTPTSGSQISEGWRPAVSVGIGMASTGGELGAPTTPFVAAARTILTPHLIAEVEWTSRALYSSFFDSGPSRPATLNDQVGEYGQYTTRREEIAPSHVGVNILGRTTVGRVSPFAGIGVARFRRTYRQIDTWIGCTGPWVPHCLTGNTDRSWETSGIGLQWLGGIDLDLNRWIQVYGNGRMSRNAGQYEASLLGGVRVALLPERPALRRVSGESAPSVTQVSMAGVRTGQKVWVTTTDGIERAGTLRSVSAALLTMSVESNDVTVPMPTVRYVETPDSTADGTVWGVVVGTGVGLFVAGYTDARALPASMLLGGGFGALVDSMRSGRRLVYSAAAPTITIAPTLTPTQASVGVRMTWR